MLDLIFHSRERCWPGLVFSCLVWSSLTHFIYCICNSSFTYLLCFTNKQSLFLTEHQAAGSLFLSFFLSIESFLLEQFRVWFSLSSVDFVMELLLLFRERIHLAVKLLTLIYHSVFSMESSVFNVFSCGLLTISQSREIIHNKWI